MRRTLIESARWKRALRHAGCRQQLDIEDLNVASATKDEELLTLNEALDKFAVADQQKAELVKLRCFAGLGIEEAAEILGILYPPPSGGGPTPAPGSFRK